jgi:Rad52/22 family double-strand break repair protein
VRISVQAGGSTIIREGHGSGEGRGASPGEVHDTALKAAETDATKRALATFGKPFGLALYGIGKSPSIQHATPIPSNQAEPVQRFGFHPDDTTPIPRPSRYYGRCQYAPLMDQLRRNSAEQKQSLAPPLVPSGLDSDPGRIDKSQLAIAEPKRLRDKAHLKFVASQPCLICGRQPSDPHHLRFAQLRGIGLKVSDEFTVPLCRGHHRQLHQAGNEVTWWQNLQIDALAIAKDLWKQTHTKHGRVDPQIQSTTIDTRETTVKN